MSKVQRISANKVGTDYICSDIHGCFEDLETKLENIGFDKAVDRLFVVGDLCDRGPSSYQALEYLEEPWFFSIFGNHEELLCKAADELNNGIEKGMWFGSFVHNGGHWAAQDKAMLLDFASVFSHLPIAIELELPSGKTVGLVHAEVCGVTWDLLVDRLEQKPHDYHNEDNDDFVRDLIWSRNKVKHPRANKPIEGIDHIFHGHTIVKEIYTKGNCSYIDTGSYLSGKITVVNPEEFV